MELAGAVELEDSAEVESDMGAKDDDGELGDAFRKDVPRVLGDVGGLTRAVDALQFGTRNAL